MQVYESKLQELQKQVETISLVAETPDEEELEEEEEEEGVYPADIYWFIIGIQTPKNIYTCCEFSSSFLSRAQSPGMYV